MNMCRVLWNNGVFQGVGEQSVSMTQQDSSLVRGLWREKAVRRDGRAAIKDKKRDQIEEKNAQMEEEDEEDEGGIWGKSEEKNMVRHSEMILRVIL